MMGVATIEGLEHVASQLPHQQLHGEPVGFACRYLRNLLPSEAAALESAGLKVVSIWEYGRPTSAGYFSRAKGVSDGRRAVDTAGTLGAPDGSAIYFAVDFDAVHDHEKAAIIEYFQGVEDGMGDAWQAVQDAGGSPPLHPIGAYGSAGVLAWLMDAGLIEYGWQAGATGWLNNREPWPATSLRTVGMPLELCGVQMSPVEALQDDIGAWDRVLG